MSDHAKNSVVWSEIPVTDMDKSIAFYNSVFGFNMTIDNTGPNPMAMYPDKNPTVVGGHIYPGKPATGGNGPTIHLAVPDKIEAAMERCTKAGGTILSPIITIPPGRFAYAHDLDGNSLALFEMAS